MFEAAFIFGVIYTEYIMSLRGFWSLSHLNALILGALDCSIPDSYGFYHHHQKVYF